jgi:hypothetical protein
LQSTPARPADGSISTSRVPMGGEPNGRRLRMVGAEQAGSGGKEGLQEKLEAWQALVEDQRERIRKLGGWAPLGYFKKPLWSPEGRSLQYYPDSLRERTVALVLCSRLGPERFPLRGNPLSLLVGAIDARMRRDPGWDAMLEECTPLYACMPYVTVTWTKNNRGALA